jgi:cytoskeleton protein RodZ
VTTTVPAAPASDAGPSAGRLLREARERQGLHIAALAASIKVQPKKLEALEADRHDLLPDTTFVRALAQTVCRALKIDPSEVLRRLPPAATDRLGPVGASLDAPFRPRGARAPDRSWRSAAAHPAVWVTLLILGASAAVLLWPEPLASGDRAAARTTPGGALVPASSPPSVVAAAETAAATVGGAATPEATLPASTATTAEPSAAPGPASVSASAASGSEPVGAVVVRALAETWVGVTDASGASLLGRTLKAGEAIGVDGTAPFRIRIGNAAKTELAFRGQPVALAEHTRDNVARLDLR